MRQTLKKSVEASVGLRKRYHAITEDEASFDYERCYAHGLVLEALERLKSEKAKAFYGVEETEEDMGGSGDKEQGLIRYMLGSFLGHHGYW